MMNKQLTVKQFQNLLVEFPHDMTVGAARDEAVKAYSAVCVSIALTLDASQGELSHRATTELGQQVEELAKSWPRLMGALHRIAHAHDEHAELVPSQLAQENPEAWCAASKALGWAQEIAKVSLCGVPKGE